MFPPTTSVPDGNGAMYMLQYCVHMTQGLEALLDVDDDRLILRHMFDYAADPELRSNPASFVLLKYLLNKVPFGRAKRFYKRYRLLTEEDQVPGLSENDLDLLWVLELTYTIETGKFPCFTAHKSLRREYDLLLITAWYGLFDYVKQEVCNGIPFTQWQTYSLLRAVIITAVVDFHSTNHPTSRTFGRS